MSLFILFSICATYCTLSKDALNSKEVSVNRTWKILEAVRQLPDEEQGPMAAEMVAAVHDTLGRNLQLSTLCFARPQFNHSTAPPGTAPTGPEALASRGGEGASIAF